MRAVTTVAAGRYVACRHFAWVARGAWSSTQFEPTLTSAGVTRCLSGILPGGLVGLPLVGAHAPLRPWPGSRCVDGKTASVAEMGWGGERGQRRWRGGTKVGARTNVAEKQSKQAGAPDQGRPVISEAARQERRARISAALERFDADPLPPSVATGRGARWRWARRAAAAAAGVTVAGVLLGDWLGNRLVTPGLDRRVEDTLAALPQPEATAVDTPDANLARTEQAQDPAGPVVVDPPRGWWPDPDLQAHITTVIPPGVARVGVAVRQLSTGASATLAGEVTMPPASVFKLGVLVEAFRQVDDGRLTLEDMLLLMPSDRIVGAGVLQTRIGQRVAVGEALRLMIGLSDNTAAEVLIRRLGTDSLNAGYRRLGLTRTYIYPDFRPDMTSASDTATLLALLATGQVAGPNATQLMLDLLVQEQPQAWIRDGLPRNTIVAHKSGQLPGVRNDAAIVYGPDGPYVLVVLTAGLYDERQGEAVISALARETYAYFAQP